MKKRRKKKRAGAEEESKKMTGRESEKNPDNDQKPFDFGGLPDRDLKKNLGCG